MTAPAVWAVGLILTIAACGGESAPEIEPAAEVAVVCGQSETRVETALVRAHGSGVDFRVTNEAGSERMLVFRQAGSVFVGPGVTEVTRTVLPGRAGVACLHHLGDPASGTLRQSRPRQNLRCRLRPRPRLISQSPSGQRHRRFDQHNTVGVPEIGKSRTRVRERP